MSVSVLLSSFFPRQPTQWLGWHTSRKYPVETFLLVFVLVHQKAVLAQVRVVWGSDHRRVLIKIRLPHFSH